MGAVGIWRHTTGASPTATAAVIDYDTEDRNDDSFYSKTGSTWNLPQGRYLVSYQLAWLASGQNNRGQVCVEARKDGTVIPGSRGSGYQRNTANDAAWANCTLIFEADDVAGNDLDFRHFRDANSSVGTYNAARSILHIVRIDDSLDFAQYVCSGTAELGATTYATVSIGSTTFEVGTKISRSGNDITLAANTSYVLCGGAWFNTTTARTTRFTHFTRGGAHIPGSSGYAYGRNSSNEFMGPNSFCVIETGGTAETITFQARGPGPGGTPVAGGANLVGTDSGITIAELPSGAEWYAAEDGTMGQSAQPTTPVTLNFNRTTTRSDSGALFSSGTTTSLTVDAAMTLFVAAGIHLRRSTSNGTRLTREADFRLNGTAQTGTASGEYNRGDQGTQDCYDSTMNPRGIISPSASDVLTLVSSRDADSGWNSGGGTCQTTGEALGFYALRTDTLGPSASTPTVTLVGVADGSAFGTQQLAASSSLATTGVQPAASFGVAGLSSDTSLALVGVPRASAVGLAGLVADGSVSTVGVPAGALFGVASLVQSAVVSVAGVPRNGAVGVASLVQSGALTTVGAQSGAAVGAAALTVGGTVTLIGVSGAAAVGPAGLSVDGNLVLAGVAQGAAVGQPALSSDSGLSLVGVLGGDAVGLAGLSADGAVTLAGVGGNAGQGAVGLTVGAVLAADGVPSSAAVGSAGLAANGFATLVGVPSGALYGVPTLVQDGAVATVGVPSGSVFGDVTLTDNPVLTLVGVAESAVVGTQALTADGSLALVGVPAGAAYGLAGLVADGAVVLVGVPLDASLGLVLLTDPAIPIADQVRGMRFDELGRGVLIFDEVRRQVLVVEPDPNPMGAEGSG